MESQINLNLFLKVKQMLKDRHCIRLQFIASSSDLRIYIHLNSVSNGKEMVNHNFYDYVMVSGVHVIELFAVGKTVLSVSFPPRYVCLTPRHIAHEHKQCEAKAATWLFGCLLKLLANDVTFQVISLFFYCTVTTLALLSLTQKLEL